MIKFFKEMRELRERNLKIKAENEAKKEAQKLAEQQEYEAKQKKLEEQKRQAYNKKISEFYANAESYSSTLKAEIDNVNDFELHKLSYINIRNKIIDIEELFTEERSEFIQYYKRRFGFQSPQFLVSLEILNRNLALLHSFDDFLKSTGFIKECIHKDSIQTVDNILYFFKAHRNNRLQSERDHIYKANFKILNDETKKIILNFNYFLMNFVRQDIKDDPYFQKELNRIKQLNVY